MKKSKREVPLLDKEMMRAVVEELEKEAKQLKESGIPLPQSTDYLAHDEENDFY